MNFNTPEISSKVNEVFFTIGQKLSAIRFILAVPEGQMMHTKSLPPIVFEYIYSFGHLQDIPWIQFIEDDLGTSIARIRVQGDKQELWELIKISPLLKRIPLKLEMSTWYIGRMTLADLEVCLFRYAQANALKKKDIF